MMVNYLYGVRVSDSEAALVSTYLDKPEFLIPQLRERAAWLVRFCRDFPRVCS